MVGVHCDPAHATLPLSDDANFYGFVLDGEDDLVWRYSGTKIEEEEEGVCWPKFNRVVLTLNCVTHTFMMRTGELVYHVTLPPGRTWYPHFALWPASELTLSGDDDDHAAPSVRGGDCATNKNAAS